MVECRGQLGPIERTLAIWVKKSIPRPADAVIETKARFFTAMCGNDDDCALVNTTGWVERFKERNDSRDPYPNSPLLPLPPITGGTPFVNTGHPQIWPASFSHQQMPMWTSPEPGPISSLAQAQHGLHDKDERRLVDPQQLQQQLNEPRTRAVGTGSKFNAENQVPLITTTLQFPGNSEGWATNNGGMPWSSTSPSSETHSVPLYLTSNFLPQLGPIERTLAIWVKKSIPRPADAVIETKARFFTAMCGNDDDCALVNTTGWVERFKERNGILNTPL
ncbi:hypothetical protein HYALB_00009817 [Hymenoscyphus albidus]|uniref:HTH CENPB-type domain-containing protein n=1 Tax=Hymenoscyphus albidus TaxID=595503 RepID=A0A9N9Q583_9HELO|nr:hypothetical protein HYALB_00009817 [Hymenoscyphus albidus]